jgi:predicted RNase H-like HicB family nuclease
MSNTAYELIIYWEKTDGIFVVEIPELPGCMAHGATRSEALAQAEEAIAAWVETAREDGVPIPEPRGRLVFA